MQTETEQASHIKDASRQMVEHIRYAYANRKSKEKPLIVIVGEQHNVPTHALTKLRMMVDLADYFDPDILACGVEMPHNMVDTALKGIKIKAPVPVTAKVLSSKFRISAQLNGNTAVTTPQSSSVLYHALTDMQVSACANDIPLKDSKANYHIDLLYAKSTGLIADMEQFQDSALAQMNVSALSDEGMFFRNTFMLAVEQWHEKLVKPKIYLHFCGEAHLDGVGTFPYKQSLMGLYNSKGYDVVGVALTHDTMLDVRNMIQSDRPNSILQIDLPGPTFMESDKAEEQEWLSRIAPQIWKGWSSTYLQTRNTWAVKEIARIAFNAP